MKRSKVFHNRDSGFFIPAPPGDGFHTHVSAFFIAAPAAEPPVLNKNDMESPERVSKAKLSACADSEIRLTPGEIGSVEPAKLLSVAAVMKKGVA